MTAGSSSAAADKALVSRIILENQCQRIIPRESAPDFGVDLLESRLNPLLDLASFLAEMFELSQMFHPGLFLGRGPQFLLDSFGDQLPQGDPAFGGRRLGAAEQEVGDFQGCFHTPILPYLRDNVSRCALH